MHKENKMNITPIKKIIEDSESRTVEFKTSTAKLSAAFQTVSAFLNGKGGTVLIGVKDNGEIMGQDITDNTRLEVANEIKKIEPSAIELIDIKYIKTDKNKFVIVIHVDPGNHIPYVY